MARKKVRRSSVVSDRCFRLLRLKHEVQNDARVMKAVVEEVDVLRLCRSLGMAVSDEGNSFAMHQLEFGLFSPSKYDADFKRFVREKLTVRSTNAAHVQEGEENVRIGSLFGKRWEVQAELERLGFWSRDCEEGLTTQEQGVYCLERADGSQDGHEFVVFAWIDAALFEPEAIRDTPAYILRFMMSLSPNVTCCLSREDFHHIESEVHALSTSTSLQWNSCSVSFRVQKQEEQSDSVRCGETSRASIPGGDPIKSLEFVGGVFPGVAVECAVPSTTRRVTNRKVVRSADLADWIMAKYEQRAVELPGEQVYPPAVRDELLGKLNLYPTEELHELRRKLEEQQGRATQRIEGEVFQRAKESLDTAVRDVELLFAVRSPINSFRMDQALGRYNDFLRRLDRDDVLSELDGGTRTALRLPERLQANMEVLNRAFTYRYPAFERTLDEIVNGAPLNARGGNQGGVWRYVTGAFRLLGGSDPFGREFRAAMEHRRTRLQRRWVDAVEQVVSTMQTVLLVQRIVQSTTDRSAQHKREEEAIKVEAMACARGMLMRDDDRQLHAKVSSLRFTKDNDAVHVKWSEEVEKEDSKVVRMYQLCPTNGAVDLSFLGTIEFEPGVEVRKLAMVKTSQAVVVLVKDGKTTVRRIHFPLLADATDQLTAEQEDVRTFPHVCSLCSIRASDRRVAFTYGTGEGRLGKVAFYRFNEAFTSIDTTRGFDLDSTFRLAAPLQDILLTERSLCALDAQGELQSFDLRTRRTSKKVSFGDGKTGHGGVGGLLGFADELVLGRARRGENDQLCVDSISSEDHRKLPSVTVGDVVSSELTAGCMNDVLYVIDAGNGVVSASELRVTVRSDAYRIQRSGAKSGRLGRPRAGRGTNEDSGEHWLRVFYHVFEKFPVRSLLDDAIDPDGTFSLGLTVVVSEAFEDQDTASNTGPGSDMHAVFKTYFGRIMADLQRLNKPLSGLDLTALLTCRSSEQHAEAGTALGITSLRHVLTAIVSFVPVQICRAEDNMLKLLQDGEDMSSATAACSRADNASDSSDSTGAEASEIAQSIRFGLLSPLLEAWNGRCVVVTSMGKQSTGKSYFLNHLAGTSFAISGSRCTDGAWMSLRFVSADVLLVVLDFEGLGSFERSEQEDIFLSVLNASVSMFTVFRMECRFDKDIDSLFARFQKGVQLIKNDPRLFRGLLYMSVKDVNMNDRQGVVDELASKLNAIFESSREQNFLTVMYAGQVVINCTPPFGTKEFFQSMENDAAKNLLSIVARPGPAATGFATGKAFLDCLRLVLAKISILDWTSMDKSTKSLAVADVKEKLPGILRTGCHVSQSLVSDETIPSSMKEDVLRVGSHEKIVVLLKDVCEATPALATKWMALNRLVPLDNIPDEQVDLGFDVTAVERRKTFTIQKTLLVLFKGFLALEGKQYGSSKLTAEDQAAFDAFVSFALRRRKMKLSCWLRGALPDSLSDVRAQLEQQFADPVLVYLSRCQHRCAHCQLGCMRSVTHSPEVEHHCTTDHVCRGVCEYSECLDEEAPPCSRAAGHKGKCECEKGEHTCGQGCVLAGASNCDGTCSKRADHAGDHRCSVQVHVCGARCSAATCKASCLLDIQREHSVHKCAEVQCLHLCLMAGCKNVCGEKDHFHGQAAESRVFAEESGITRPLGSSQDADEEVTHMCLASHACEALCRVDGICEQKVHLKKSARTYTGARCSFEYVLQEMNGCKKRCVHALPSGLLDHEGKEHSCIATSSVEGEIVHYCDVRCPSCSYYCNKRFGHMGLHATSHGNMRQTYFMAKDTDVDVDDRKYQVGEKGIAEMCNLFCTKMGRGHVHFLTCESKEGENCVYTGDGSKDHRRHCTDELFPPPEKPMDTLLHSQFWTAIGWEDPCSDEERALFSKCPFQCDAPEHEEPDKAPSFCLLDAWHQPELKPDVDDGFAYVDGHKFECVHAVDTGKFHSIFVLDSSGSMSGQPWRDLLCACNEYGINRLGDGGAGDLTSFISFDNTSRIHCEAQPLQEALHVKIPYTGGGTYFEEGLRAANEVLSRNKFEHFKAVLIFFSDGRPRNIEEAIRLARTVRVNYAKYDLRAFVVGFGHVNLSVLQRLAAEMGGEYRQVLDADALRTEFQRIAAVLKKNEASLALMDA